MSLSELVKDNREAILRAAADRGATNVRIFGSVARGEAGPESDVDVLVDLLPGKTLFDLGGLLIDLEELLGCRVHLVTEGAIHWYIKDRVLSEAVPL